MDMDDMTPQQMAHILTLAADILDRIGPMDVAVGDKNDMEYYVTDARYTALALRQLAQGADPSWTETQGEPSGHHLANPRANTMARDIGLPAGYRCLVPTNPVEAARGDIVNRADDVEFRLAGTQQLQRALRVVERLRETTRVGRDRAA